MRSIETARTIRKLARDLKLEKICLIANKIQNPSDNDFIGENADGLEVLGYLPFDERLMQADRLRLPVWELCPEALERMRTVCSKIAPQP
jgi:CO dehydrogenase maturation factor